MIQVQIVNKSNNPLPEYAKFGDAGMDLRANLNEPVTIDSLERKLIPTGIYIKLPEGYEAQVRPRSGNALKYGLSVCNAPGTIDPFYLGEICVILINLGKEQVVINNGDRIAQLVFKKFEQAELIEVEQLDTTNDRGGGFGHTGLK